MICALHHILLEPSNLIKEDDKGGTYSTKGKKINAYTGLVGKPEGKRPCVRPSCR